MTNIDVKWKYDFSFWWTTSNGRKMALFTHRFQFFLRQGHFFVYGNDGKTRQKSKNVYGKHQCEPFWFEFEENATFSEVHFIGYFNVRLFWLKNKHFSFLTRLTNNAHLSNTFWIFMSSIVGMEDRTKVWHEDLLKITLEEGTTYEDFHEQFDPNCRSAVLKKK